MLRCVVWILAGIGLALSLSGSAQATTLSIIQITSTGQDFLRSNGTPSNTAHVDTVDITVTGGDFLTQFDLTTSAGTFSTLNFTLDGLTFYNALVPGLPITLTLLESVGQLLFQFL